MSKPQNIPHPEWRIRDGWGGGVAAKSLPARPAECSGATRHSAAGTSPWSSPPPAGTADRGHQTS